MSADRSGPLAVAFGVHCVAELIVAPDREHDVVAVELVADRRCRLVVEPEVALQLALDLVATVAILRRASEPQP